MVDAVSGQSPPSAPPGTGSEAEQWPRLLALFGGAMAVRLGVQLPLWAYEHGCPAIAGCAPLLRPPMLALRLVRGLATVVALFTGGTLLLEGRRRWLAHLEEVRVLAPLPASARG